MRLRSLKFSDPEFREFMDGERIFTDYFLHFFFRIAKRKDDPTGSRHLSAGRYEDILLVVFVKELHMVGHVLVELFQWHDVVEIDDKHSKER